MSEEPIKTLQITYRHINLLNEYCGLSLPKAESRTRNRFLKIFEERRLEGETERKSLLQELAVKDPSTGQAKVDKAGNYELGENSQKFIKEFTAMLDNKVLVDILPAQVPDFEWGRDFVHNLDRNFTREEMTFYEELDEKLMACIPPKAPEGAVGPEQKME